MAPCGLEDRAITSIIERDAFGALGRTRGQQMSTNEDLIGRADLNDIEAIMAIAAEDGDENIRAVKDNAEAIFTWDYEKGKRPALNKLYEKAKHSQWNGETDLPWDTAVDPMELVELQRLAFGHTPEARKAKSVGTPFEKWGDKEYDQMALESNNWMLSQFMHGEQGALICTARITETVPWYDAKLFAATQVVDEARHVEVFAKYLETKLSGYYPINAHLEALLNDIISDSRWDMTYLGMQIMVEGLALAAFGFMHMITTEPLLKQLLRYVMSDEARHVAFGVISLKEAYEDMSGAEIRERQEFAYEAGLRMRDRFLMQEVWDRMGVDVKKMVKLQLSIPNEYKDFQKLLFSKIVPNCRKLGLLDAGDGWLRQKWTDLGVIEFENWADTGEEYADLDAVAADREAAA